MRLQMIGHETFTTLKAIYKRGVDYMVEDAEALGLLEHKTPDGSPVFIAPADSGDADEVVAASDAAPKKVLLGKAAVNVEPPPPPATPPAPGTVTEV